MSKNDYIKKCLVSFIIFCAGTMFNLVRPHGGGDISSGVPMVLFWITIILILYSIYLYTSSTMKIFEQNEISKWYALTPIYILIVASVVSMVESVIPENIEHDRLEEHGVYLATFSVVSYLLTTFFAFSTESKN